uniref:trypsin n=1 Tax=Periophthalmus magnuspinnatus TaxID=409849 RepID=A0A3B4ACI7_9GOBI
MCQSAHVILIGVIPKFPIHQKFPIHSFLSSLGDGLEEQMLIGRQRVVPLLLSGKAEGQIHTIPRGMLQGEWPWQVSLWLRSQSKGTHPLCGASLINSCWALSAAHCFKRFGTDPSRYLLRLGDYHTQEQDDFERTLSPERIVIHRKYQSHAWDYDIALVRLKGIEGSCVAFNPHTSAVCLPEFSHKWVTRSVSYSEYSRTLKQAWVPLLPSWKCKKRYGARFTSRMICAGSLSEQRRVDSCQGDSGGPLVCQHGGGHWVLTGVISWGHGCGNPAFPGVYTRVSRFLRWIDNVGAELSFLLIWTSFDFCLKVSRTYLCVFLCVFVADEGFPCSCGSTKLSAVFGLLLRPLPQSPFYPGVGDFSSL